MPACYLCGRTLPSQLLLRRKVRTGEFVTVAYPGKVEKVRKSFGQRVVCPTCARRVDRVRRRDEVRQLLGSFAVLATILAIYAWESLK